MVLKDPIDIDLLAFIRAGKFDYIKLGQTKEWIINNFPDPDGTYMDSYNSPIWFYGNIEFHFSDDDELFLIYSDYIDTLNGGESLRLHKWIFDKPEELTLQTVAENLAGERIAYKLEFFSFSDGTVTASIRILESGVLLGFYLPENADEDNAEYLERLRKTNSNFFKVYSISLIRN